MVVGTCRITVRMTGLTSLKGKRGIVKRIVERTKNRFNAAVAEVGLLNQKEEAQIGIAVIGNERPFINSMLDKIIDFIEEIGIAEIVRSDVEIISL